MQGLRNLVLSVNAQTQAALASLNVSVQNINTEMLKLREQLKRKKVSVYSSLQVGCQSCGCGIDCSLQATPTLTTAVCRYKQEQLNWFTVYPRFTDCDILLWFRVDQNKKKKGATATINTDTEQGNPIYM